MLTVLATITPDREYTIFRYDGRLWQCRNHKGVLFSDKTGREFSGNVVRKLAIAKEMAPQNVPALEAVGLRARQSLPFLWGDGKFLMESGQKTVCCPDSSGI
ncbi:MAG: hypothetical protein PHS41_09455 [Victivallaceae bacterium]|nr:hypothetical protein [Victivallaceae bacterium]